MQNPKSINFDSTNVIYIITCTKCNKQYVGKKRTKLKYRFTEHLRDIRKNEDTTVQYSDTFQSTQPHHTAHLYYRRESTLKNHTATKNTKNNFKQINSKPPNRTERTLEINFLIVVHFFVIFLQTAIIIIYF